MAPALRHVGIDLAEQALAPGEVVWSPANLRDGSLYYWRVRLTDELDVRNPALREYGPWSETGHFYTDFTGDGGTRAPPVSVAYEESGIRQLPAVELMSPEGGDVVTSHETYLTARVPPE